VVSRLTWKMRGAPLGLLLAYEKPWCPKFSSPKANSASHSITASGRRRTDAGIVEADVQVGTEIRAELDLMAAHDRQVVRVGTSQDPLDILRRHATCCLAGGCRGRTPSRSRGGVVLRTKSDRRSRRTSGRDTDHCVKSSS
jgi:hypothetical protein